MWEQNVTLCVVVGYDLIKVSEQLCKSGTQPAWIQQYNLPGFRVPSDRTVYSPVLKP